MKVCLNCGNRFKSSDWECPICHRKPEQKNGFLLFAPELAEFNTGFDPGYFSQLAEVEANNFWFRARNRLLIWAFRSYFPHAKNFLEIGCGTGFVLSGIEKAFPGIILYGAEIFSSGLSYAAERLSRVALFQMDACRIPFDNEFDVIGSFDVLEHIEYDDIALLKMFQASNEGGGIIITVPQHPFLWTKVDKHAHHFRRYNARELKIKVERAGFKVIKVTSFVSLLLPFMIVSRLKKWRSRTKYDALSELKISGFLNIALEKILDFERILIYSGISFPVGGSILLIARKVSGDFNEKNVY